MTEIQVQGDTFFVAVRGFGPGLLPMALSVAMRGQVALAWKYLYEHECNAIVLFNRLVDSGSHEFLSPHSSEQLAIMLLHRLERMKLPKPQSDGEVKAGWIVKAGDSLPDAIRNDRNILCIVAPTWEVFGK